MAYQIAAIWMTLSDLQGHSPTASLSKCDFFVQLCGTRQDFNWYSASLGPCVIAVLLVCLCSCGWPPAIPKARCSCGPKGSG